MRNRSRPRRSATHFASTNVLSDEVLDRIDEIVPPGTDIGPFDQAQAYVPPAIEKTQLRREELEKGLEQAT